MSQLVHDDFDYLNIRIVNPGNARMVNLDMSRCNGRHFLQLRSGNRYPKEL